MAETGLILKGVGGFYTVLNDRGEEVVCRARGRFRKDGISPVVGAEWSTLMMAKADIIRDTAKEEPVRSPRCCKS